MPVKREVAPPLDELESCADWEAAAKSCMSIAAWEYISGGETETMARNRDAFSDFAIRPRILRDVSVVDVSCNLFGSSLSTPFYLSSVAKGGLVAESEATFVRAAARSGSVYLAPSVLTAPLADLWLARAPGQQLPFQFYLLNDEEGSFELLKEALELGTPAVVVTVDANAPRAGAFLRSTASSTGTAPSPRLTWTRLAEIRSLVPASTPLYLKGVQTAEDALKAVRLGIRGIVVSNHGGRCCGDAWGSLHALEDVTSALRDAGFLGGKDTSPAVEILFDSGVRSGRDAVKALCLGAHGIGLGRPYYWAAACHGEDGIVALLANLSSELRHAMAQLGASSLRDLDRSLLCRTRPPPALLLPAAALPAKL